MRSLFLASYLLMIFAGLLFSQQDNFILSTHRFNPYYPTYTGNGYFSLSSTRLGTSEAESYMIKVYGQGKDDIPRIANLPAWNEINYHNGNKWVNETDSENGFDSAQFSNYTQTLNMFTGTLETHYSWKIENRNTDFNILSFVSRQNKNLAIIRVELTAGFSDVVSLSFPLKERAQYNRMPLAKLEKIAEDTLNNWPKVWYPGFVNVTKISAHADANGGMLELLAQCEGRDTRIAEAAAVIYEGVTNPKITSAQDNKSGEILIKFKTEKGKKYTFYKVVAVTSSITDGSDFQQKATAICKSARNSKFSNLFENHKKEWSNLWNTDIRVDGDNEFQKAIHSAMYYILCSIRENTDFSLPPMGLSSSGYYGHVFWDADTYMFPPLLFMHPGISKSVVMFRVNALDAAKENAAKNKYKGAMYPWESDELGKETTPFFAYQNAIKENHIVGDVALAQWQYFLATKDTNWLRNYGAKVINATADFWVSRVDYNKAKDRYEIGRIVSVSESMKDVSNETYTNSVAKINLELAVKTSAILKTSMDPKWQEISSKMFIPFDEKHQYHPTYENAPSGTKEATEFWTSVAPLLSFPLQMQMSQTAKKNDLLNAVEGLKQIGAGANMGINFLPIIAAELGNDSLFNFTLENTYRGFLRPPFNVLAETHKNKSVNFITGAGAFLQQIIFGYTGLRLTEKGLVPEYNPMLPKNINSLLLKNFTINNETYDITVKGNKLKLTPIK